MKKSKSINQLKTINKKIIEQPQGLVKNQIVRKEDENIYAILNTNQDDDFPHLRKLKQMQKGKSLTPIERNRREYEVVQNNLQEPTQRLNEIRLPQMRNTKNFIEENKNKIQNKEMLKKSSQKEEIDTAVHKNFGKTPEYLQKFKKDAEDKKEFLKRKAEEAKFPKGTRLISEEERLETLHSLENSKKEIITLLEKMPISMKTITLQNRKTELEKKLDEIEDAIRTFSRKQVFIKIDN